MAVRIHLGSSNPPHPTEGKEEGISVYESTGTENGMLFSIHQACLNLMNQMCEIRKEQCRVGSTR